MLRIESQAAAATPLSSKPGQSQINGSDAEFLAHFESRQLTSWGHRDLIRVVYCYLGLLGRSNESVDRIMMQLQDLQGSGFSSTITYFWIQVGAQFAVSLTHLMKDQFLLQMVTASLMPDYREVLFPQKKGKETSESSSTGEGLGASRDEGSGDSAASWIVKLPEFSSMVSVGAHGKASKAMVKVVSEPLMYLEFYSKGLVYSKGAEEAVVLPDKKPLPNVI